LIQHLEDSCLSQKDVLKGGKPVWYSGRNLLYAPQAFSAEVRLNNNNYDYYYDLLFLYMYLLTF